MSAPIYPVAGVTIGIAKEPSYGAATAPAFFLPWANLNPDDVHGLLPDVGWRSVPVDSVGHSPGPLAGVISVGGNAHADTIGFPIAGVLGDVVSAGSNPTTHTIALLTSGTQQPPSYSFTITDPVQPLVRPGGKFSSLNMGFTADGLLTWSADAQTLAASPASAAASSFGTVRAMAGWTAAVKLGGTTVTNCLSASLSIARTITAKRNPDGTQAPYLQRSEGITVSGQASLIMAVDTYRAAFQAGTQTNIDVSLSAGSGATATQIAYHCSDIVFTDADEDLSSGPYMVLNLSWKADANASDVGASGGLSPIKFTLKNQVASGTYA